MSAVSKIKEINSWVRQILTIAGVTCLLMTFVGSLGTINGSSMETTLSDQDKVIMDKWSLLYRDPERFEIIIFSYYQAESDYFIKRVIGVPGETIQIKQGTVYINGTRLEESYEAIVEPGLAKEPIVLGDDEYFVLGDNRNHSADSRDPSVGVVRRSKIEGIIEARVYPFSQFTIFKDSILGLLGIVAGIALLIWLILTPPMVYPVPRRLIIKRAQIHRRLAPAVITEKEEIPEPEVMPEAKEVKWVTILQKAGEFEAKNQHKVALALYQKCLENAKKSDLQQEAVAGIERCRISKRDTKGEEGVCGKIEAQEENTDY